MDINEVSIYNILIIIFVFLKDNYLPNSNLNDIYENSQIESFDDGNYNISNLNQSNCINIQDNDSKTKMQTNYKSNKLNLMNQLQIKKTKKTKLEKKRILIVIIKKIIISVLSKYYIY